jgi:hypothetical protein
MAALRLYADSEAERHRPAYCAFASVKDVLRPTKPNVLAIEDEWPLHAARPEGLSHEEYGLE